MRDHSVRHLPESTSNPSSQHEEPFLAPDDQLALVGASSFVLAAARLRALQQGALLLPRKAPRAPYGLLSTGTQLMKCTQRARSEGFHSLDLEVALACRCVAGAGLALDGVRPALATRTRSYG
ncbi:MAG: hypothetical protein QOG05_200 [Streptosporangiaceae bacterium]|nr:hypothetical protein [Streptosporangiaceae bacterium]